MPFQTFDSPARWVIATRFCPYIPGTNNRILVSLEVEGFTPLQISTRVTNPSFTVTPYIFLWTGDSNNTYYSQRIIVVQGPTRGPLAGSAPVIARTGSFTRAVTLLPGEQYINVELCTISTGVPYEVAPTWTARNITLATLKK